MGLNTFVFMSTLGRLFFILCYYSDGFPASSRLLFVSIYTLGSSNFLMAFPLLPASYLYQSVPQVVAAFLPLPASYLYQSVPQVVALVIVQH